MGKNLKFLFLIAILGIIFTPNLFSKTLLIDNFEQELVNSLGGKMDICTSNASITPFYESDSSITFGRSGKSLGLSYNISVDESWAALWSKLKGLDLTEYNYLSFWIKGQNGGETVKIELHNKEEWYNYNATNTNTCAQIYVSEYLDGGITQDWQKVVIPLDTFLPLYQMTNIVEIVFSFEEYASTENGSPKKGTVYIDDLLVGTWDPKYVRLDHYGDKVERCTLGGNISSGGANGGWITNTYVDEEYKDYPYSLKIEYNVNSANSYVFCWHLFGYGDKWTKTDLSKYNYLSFWAKSTNENIYGNGIADGGKGMKIEMKTNDCAGASFFTRCTTISNIWQKFVLPLTNFKAWWVSGDPPIDKSKIVEIVWVFESNNLYLEDRIGTVYIDNVQFQVDEEYIPDTTPPATPYSLKNNGESVEDGYVFGAENYLTVNASSSSDDDSIECVYFEYSTDGGTTWYRIATDYDTSDNEYSCIWNTTSFSDKFSCSIRVRAIDASGNYSFPLVYNNCAVIPTEEITKPTQTVITPNGDNVNDVLIFPGLKENFEIKIFDSSGHLIKTIDDTNQWDGTDGSGKIVENGIYIYQCKVNGKLKYSGLVGVAK